ncbi:unnamed protein product, partial [Polarella glacialis]
MRSLLARHWWAATACLYQASAVPEPLPAAHGTDFACDCWFGTPIHEAIQVVFAFLSQARPLFRSVWIAKRELGSAHEQLPGVLPHGGWLLNFTPQMCDRIWVEMARPAKHNEFNTELFSQVMTETLTAQQGVLGYCPMGFMALSYFCADVFWVQSKEGGTPHYAHFGMYAITLMDMFAKFYAVPGVDDCLRSDRNIWPFIGPEAVETYSVFVREVHLAYALFFPLAWDVTVNQLLKSMPEQRPSLNSLAWQPAASLPQAAWDRHVCPPEPEVEEPDPELVERVAVACFVLAVWPQERDAMEDFEFVLRPHCDWFAAFVALPPEAVTNLPAIPPGWSVVDLASVFPGQILADRWEDPPNSLQKFHLAVRFMREKIQWSRLTTNSKDWWFCGLESDVFFIPENVRRLIALRRLNSSQPHWLGGPRLHTLGSDGVLLEPLLGSCLATESLRRLALLVKVYSRAAEGNTTSAIDMRKSFAGHRLPVEVYVWPHTLYWCEPLQRYGYTEVMEVVTACLRAVGVYPVDPLLMFDRRGRAYFPMLPLDSVAANWSQPPSSPYRYHSNFQNFNEDAFTNWNGKEYMYAACQRAGQKIWVADYPVIFHPHIRKRLGMRVRKWWGGTNTIKPFLSPRALDGIL